MEYVRYFSFMTWDKSSLKQRQEVIRGIFEEQLKLQELTFAELGTRMSWSRGHASNIIKGTRNLDFNDWLDLCRALELEPTGFLAEFERKLQE